MANNIRSAIKSLASWMLPSSNEVSTDDSSKICWIFILPPEILQTVTEYLSVRDILSLSETCRDFHALINDDNFWIHRICCQFPSSMSKRYTVDIFNEPKRIRTEYETCSSGFENIRADGELDLAAIHSATHYNDNAVEKSHTNMYISKEDFLIYLRYFQFKEPKHIQSVPLMKLLYFYMIDRKRLAVVNMHVIHRNNHYLVEESDRDSLTGRIISLRAVCWLEITGSFEKQIMPGKYEVLWRMKFHSDQVYMWGETEFTVVPSHGKMLIHKISMDDFQHYKTEHPNQWFLVNMGHIVVYELSKVLVGIRNWANGNWKSGVSWDCVELKLIP